MRDFFELIGSLVRPFFGSIGAVLKGEFGWTPAVGILKQVVFQAMFLGMFCSVTGGSFVIAMALLLGLHLVLAFLTGAAAIGYAFGNGDPTSEDSVRNFARQALLWTAVASVLPTIAILGFASHGGFFMTVLAIVFSAAAGAAIDVHTVVATFDNIARASRARLNDAPVTTRETGDEVTAG